MFLLFHVTVVLLYFSQATAAAAAGAADAATVAAAATAAAEAALQYLQGAGIGTRDSATTFRCATNELQYTHP